MLCILGGPAGDELAHGVVKVCLVPLLLLPAVANA